ncbi:antibiotic biosynthesis monooxygenase family protein [Pseudomarimonas salicorniae]|uniref:Antibiotic biosynthesis monooxygenase n=1 Tax=Pseudomarimonas salicorniae TaxID=2933270 RepID=A0ABT0GG01_9GAMM|nr:antibiotic biosynthesis monooxygenase [Lysobacter sp. CAU 1642]MCK7593471.1 antibiotic biosynthesis monooxygenase [Lysobacter sp. CAU 1642]
MLFIFEVEIGEGYSAEQYAEAWVRASRLIQQAEGAAGTRLHRCIGDPRRLLAIARWESKAARDAMAGAPQAQIREIIDGQAEFVSVRILGEFEEAEWRVDPPDAQ